MIFVWCLLSATPHTGTTSSWRGGRNAYAVVSFRSRLLLAA